MEHLATFVFVIFLVFGLIMAIAGLWEKRNDKIDCRDAFLDHLYKEIWNGSAGDRVAAWDRVILHIQHFRDDEAMLEAAMERRDAEVRAAADELSCRMIVNTEGHLKTRDNNAPRFRRNEPYLDYLVRAANQPKEHKS